MTSPAPARFFALPISDAATVCLRLKMTPSRASLVSRTRYAPSVASPTAPTRPSTRSSRGTRSRRTCSSSASTPSSSRGSRARLPGAHARRARLRGARVATGPRTSAPTTGGCAGASSRSRREDRPTEPYPVSFCERCDFLTLCEAEWERRRPPLAGRGPPPHAVREAPRRPGSRRSPSSPRWPRRRRHPRRASATRPRSSSTRARPASRSTGCSRPRRRPASRSCRSRRRATSSSTWRATRSGIRRAGSSTSSASSTRTAPLHRRSGRTTARASGARSSSSSTSCTSACAPTRAMHVYHYAAYEVTALKRLMGQYGTREREVDDLLRRDVFVDLYAVVRNALRVSQPRYSIKNLEVFLPIEREAEIKEGGTSILMFEEWMRTRRRRDPRGDRRLQRGGLPRDAPPPRLAARAQGRGDRRVRADPERRRPVDPKRGEAGEGRARRAARALAPRDRRPAPRRSPASSSTTTTASASRSGGRSSGAWRRRRRSSSRTPRRSACSSSSPGPSPWRKSQAWTFTFPPQEHKIGRGQDVVDPATGSDAGDDHGARPRGAARSCSSAGPSSRTSRCRRRSSPGGPYDTKAQEDALMRFGRSLLAGDRALSGARVGAQAHAASGADPDERPRRAGAAPARARRRPPLRPGPARLGEDVDGRPARRAPARGREARRRRVARATRRSTSCSTRSRRARTSSGSTCAAARRRAAGNPESFYESERIENLHATLEDCLELAARGRDGLALRAIRASTGSSTTSSSTRAGRSRSPTRSRWGRARGTSCSSATRSSSGRCSRARTRRARARPCSSTCSATTTTIPRGSRRLPRADVAAAPGRLPLRLGGVLRGAARAGRAVTCDALDAARDRRALPAVEHEGTAAGLAGGGGGGRGAEIDARMLAATASRGRSLRDFIVVAPYNAQVNLLREALPEGVPVGTVDKFQGQEAEVVFYSMASSSGEDIPRGARVPLLAQPPERGGLAGAVPGVRRVQPAAAGDATRGRWSRCGW